MKDLNINFDLTVRENEKEDIIINNFEIFSSDKNLINKIKNFLLIIDNIYGTKYIFKLITKYNQFFDKSVSYNIFIENTDYLNIIVLLKMLKNKFKEIEDILKIKFNYLKRFMIDI